jgi:hypothetical protein
MNKYVWLILFFLMIISTWAFEACNSGCQSAPATGQNIGTEFDNYQP